MAAWLMRTPLAGRRASAPDFTAEAFTPAASQAAASMAAAFTAGVGIGKRQSRAARGAFEGDGNDAWFEVGIAKASASTRALGAARIDGPCTAGGSSRGRRVGRDT